MISATLMGYCAYNARKVPIGDLAALSARI